MSNQAGQNFVQYSPRGIFFYDSSSLLTLSTSQSSIPLISAVTCAADLGNNIATTSSLSGYFVVPLITGSPSNTSLIPSQLNVIYNTGSLFTVSASNTSLYYQPTSSGKIVNHNLYVEIEKNDNANTVASKTYKAITGSFIYKGTTFNYISASIAANIIKIFHQYSQSFSGNDIFISASGFGTNIIQSGSFGSGSATNYTAPRGQLSPQSASLVVSRDIDDTTQSSFMFRIQSGSFGGSEHRDFLYISASVGKLGFGTSDPQTDVDIRANDFKIQRKTERKGLIVNSEGNVESFDRTAATSATGSEFILNYSRGTTITPRFLAFNGLTGGTTGSNNTEAQETFNALSADRQASFLEAGEQGGFITPPSVGDVLGQIRWITESGSIDSLDKRIAAETATIKAVAAQSAADGVAAELHFGIASRTGASSHVLKLKGTAHQLTGSLDVGAFNFLTKGGIQRPDNSNTFIDINENDIQLKVNSSVPIAKVTSNVFEINTSQAAQIDFVAKGDNDGNLLYVDAGVDKVGIGEQPGAGSSKFNITGDATISSHITASGNISSSGPVSVFGQVVHLEGTDPRLKLKAKGANHPGVEWHEDGTRKWVLYNDPDESDSIVFKNDSTELFKVTQAGEVQVTDVISHIGDTDTKITFTDDDINITVGNVNMLDFTENAGSQDEITFNEAGADLDIRMEGDADQNLFFLNAGTDKVGIGSNSPGEKLEVVGNISASGTITALSSNIVTINGGSF